jgi:FkbM family methyltransferase
MLIAASNTLKRFLPSRFRRRWLKPSNFWTWDLDRMTGELPDFRVSLRRMRSLGFRPDLIVDVGAWEGTWSEMAANVWPHADVLMVEAIEDKFVALRNRFADKHGWRIAHAVLSGRAGDVREFQQMGTGSSIYPELSDYPRHTGSVITQTLDDVVRALELRPKSILLKLDVQGAELDILAGATHVLSSTQWMALEVSLTPTNAGAPLFCEVISRCKALGFVVADFAGFHRHPETTQLRQVDVIFARSP